MENLNIQKELDLLLAERLLSGFIDGQKCIDWAISLMQRNYESDNLYILAGLDFNDGFAIEHYFERLIDDFGLLRNRNVEELFLLYISDIALQVIEGKIEALRGLDIMWKFDLNLLTNLLNQFLYLSEDISLLGGCQLFYIGLTKKNIDEVIIDEMKMFLIALSKGWEDVSNMIYCNECKDFSHSRYKEKGWLLKKGGWYCERCDSKKYLAWYNVTDRKQILNMLENYEKAI